MKDKHKEVIYYKPRVEEFYIGFEYQTKVIQIDLADLVESTVDEFLINLKNGVPKTKYIERYIDKICNDLDEIKSEDILNNLRVSYLNIDDITDLGFELIKDTNPGMFYSFKFNDKSNTTVMLCKMDYGRCVIKNDCKMFMDITLKNKSEFKKLLIQLNIINEHYKI